MSKYAINARTTVFGGYANMRYSNPSSPLTAGITTIGGYVLSFLNQTAFTVPKTLQVYWGGSKYSLTKKLDLIGAYYGWRQNSYLGNGCSNNSSSKCSGNRNDESVNGIYKLTSHIDLYAGLDWSNVSNGLSAGYLYTSNLSVMAGTRIKF
jgi:predicted porin